MNELKNKDKDKDKIWQVAHNPCGRPRKFKSPDALWKRFLEYCKWVDDNPWQNKAASNGIIDDGDGKRNSINQNVKVMQRPYTLYGFCAFAGVPKWADFKSSYIDKDGFSEVISSIENVILTQQIDGAMLRQYDSNLVARLNGIADKQINEVTGKDGSDFFKLPKLTKEDLEELAKLNGIH
jgi:hypothetical protein